ncbi:nitrate reductase molybdenum cofactor assembly chaperone [Mycolicibacterium pulveris]|uniref:Nitrate reductase molybdenum cofactor assembly chaperone n=1 Tax=Mycolicibacterium pulveris TaxID=36813 RepID=A0A7I7URD7_MYCPV|nr:nitrate reductase molybdenum cofactor assembly chaperone [Mycolicibacterium pulveris]MCV6982304.1 nitrate reductase molybdenum cofactor assembly chaperone [Mycolicibacterium pulveris]BBY84045.1 nitrate reductase molybdenum cofactor assembly chaperone [Mycolicibacterium pulveris]
MKLLGRKSNSVALTDRLVWQAASLLLCYPDDGCSERLGTVDELIAHIGDPAATLLARTAEALRASDWTSAAAQYVETFDLRRASTMYLTYWTAGDTRNRGHHMLAFNAAYREAGVPPPSGEAPDYLPVVLEFAATVDPQAGRRLLVDHRVPIDVLYSSLNDTDSPYAHAVAAVRHTFPAPSEQEAQRARRLAEAGPPAEAVGLEPFTLTVPPRRAGVGDRATQGVH